MVASDSPEASQIGASVLRSGGNAFDAAVAVSFALAVARPESTGLGGGGFMVGYIAQSGGFVALDFRETAPSGVTAEHFAKLDAERGDGPSPSVYGGNGVCVPGQLRGLVAINRHFGTRSLAQLIAPAVELAETGFVIDKHFADACDTAATACARWPQLREVGRPLLEMILVAGKTPEVGARLKRPGLARALRLIAAQGADVFYDGPIGEAVVEAVEKAGGTLTMEDLRAYQAIERAPIRGQWLEYEIVSMPPPSAGGACLVEMAHVLEAMAIRSDIHPLEGRPHMLVEAMKHAFADRARWFGDPGFGEIPVERLTSRAYAVELARRIKAHGTRAADEYGSQSDADRPRPDVAGSPPDDGGTSHFCVADRFGNVVALTETINGTFGSLLVAAPYGIVLNNEMDDFTTIPEQANLYGLVQGRANLVAPGKRPLSSMTPTILMKDGKPVFVLGASGGPRIISSVAQVMLNVAELEQPLAEAMQAVRLHHQWQPDVVYFDRQPPADLARRLREFGHKLGRPPKTGIVQAIQMLEGGRFVGASDPRKGGRPAGVP
ncbi:MAG: gamma-glutamyltransferase [Planctomycetes bacterium]|nr:gamma-glutamyltransferase [Planctomycetota bacterium]